MPDARSSKIGNQEDCQSATPEQFQHEITEIWPQLAARPALHTWLRVVKHATAACEGVRKSEWHVVLKEIAKSLVWWLAFIEKLNALSRSQDDGEIVFAVPFSASRIIWDKYPWVCPVEFGLEAQGQGQRSWPDRPAQRCKCLALKEETENRSPTDKRRAKRLLRQFAANHESQRPHSITELEYMLRQIFSGPIYLLNVHEITLHFLEEVGEVSKALSDATVSEAATSEQGSARRFTAERERKIYAIAEELADVFSWAVTFLAKVRLHLVSFEKWFEGRSGPKEFKEVLKAVAGAKQLNLADIIWQQYGLDSGELGCADCRRRRCECDEENQRLLHGKYLEQFRKPMYRLLSRLG